MCDGCRFVLPTLSSVMPLFSLVLILPAVRGFRLIRSFLGGTA